jgi:NADPH:quinone reductase-like Zn-dependent oxidoreductase
MDFSGVVIDAWHPNGEEKARFKKGDAVVAMLPAAHMLATGTGALAEHVAVPAKYVVHKPESVGLADAAGAMLPGLTAWELVAAAKLKPGDRVLINAAAGGIGSMVVQMVRNAVGKDGYIVGISGTKNQSLVRSLGADEVRSMLPTPHLSTLNTKYHTLTTQTVDYTIHSNLPSHLAILFSPRPFDAIIDAIGVHALFVSSPSYLVPNGVYSSVGVRPPDFSVPNFFRAVIRMKLNEWWPVSSWLGGFGRLWHGVSVMAPSLEDRQRVADLLGKGDVRVVRDSIWKFEDVKLAYERLASGHVSGKILVKVDAALDDDA